MVIGKGYITIAVIHDGVDGVDGANGYTVTATPSVITLGITKVSDTAFDADTTKNNTSAIRVFKGNVDVTKTCRVTVMKKENCTATGPFENGSGLIKVTRMSTYTEADGVTYPFTTGSVTVAINTGSTTLSHTIAVNVDMSVVWGGVESIVNGLKSEFGEFQKDLQSEAPNVLTKYTTKIEQTTREISLSVSEKSIGRRNLLVGSAFRRQGEVSYIVDSHPYFIRMNDGYGSTNCAYMSKSGMTQNVWCGAMWNPVTVKPNTKYTFSMMLKVMSVCDERFDVQFIDVTYNSSNSVAFDTLAAADKMETFGWTLKKITITTPSLCTKLRIDAFIRRNGTAYMCRPMLEEGENYNGWTLSEQDYDYIGGNMLDNTLSLDKSGSLYDVNGTLTPSGFGESTSIYKSFVYKLKGTVDSFSQLPLSGNVYDDTYYVRNDGTCYAYNGSEFVDVGNDYYHNILEWRKGKPGAFTSFGLEANKDYVFSFMAKGTGLLTAYFYNPETDVFIESSLGATNISVDGNANFQLTNKWERYWVHWRPSDSLHKYVLLRLNRSFQSNGSAPVTDCYIAQPKLEEGAMVTE